MGSGPSYFLRSTVQPSTDMKTQLYTAAILSAAILSSCGPSEAEKAAAAAQAKADSLQALMSMERQWAIDPTSSKITWSSTMVGVKEHHGTINLTSGTMTTKGPTVIGGEFNVDLKLQTADMLDTNYAPDGSEKGTRANLIGHLMSPDFFAADSFPTASFKITSVSGNTATGDLTVRGRTNPETVTDVVVTEEAGVVKATGKLIFDRQKYNVAWSSGSKDYVLSDDIVLNIELVGKTN